MARRSSAARAWADFAGPPDIQPAGAAVADASLTEGQRRRVRLFQSVESTVSARIESICASTAVDVSDIGVLVVAEAAYELMFGESGAPGTTVVVGHRTRLYTLLSSLMRGALGGADPYIDLLSPAPPCCVRVLVVDERALTVLSYGSFVSIPRGPDTPSA